MEFITNPLFPDKYLGFHTATVLISCLNFSIPVVSGRFDGSPIAPVAATTLTGMLLELREGALVVGGPKAALRQLKGCSTVTSTLIVGGSVLILWTGTIFKDQIWLVLSCSPLSHLSHMFELVYLILPFVYLMTASQLRIPGFHSMPVYRINSTRSSTYVGVIK